MKELTFHPLLPPWLLFLFAAVFLLLVFKRLHRMRFSTLCLHALVFASLAVISLGPSREEKSAADPAFVFCIDASKSMRYQDRFFDAVDLIYATHLAQALEELDVKFCLFDYDIREAPYPLLAEAKATGSSTRIGASIQSVLNRYPGLLGIVLLSDGVQTEGLSASAAARAAAEKHVPVHCIALGRYDASPDAMVLTPLHTVLRGNPGTGFSLPVRVVVSGKAPTRTTVELFQNEEKVTAAEVAMEDQIGETKLELMLPDTRLTEWTIRVLPLEGERKENRANNTVRIFTETEETAVSVLLLEGTPTWEGTFCMKALASDPRFSLQAARLLTPDRPVLTSGLSEKPFPFEADLFSEENFQVLVLGGSWETACRTASAPFEKQTALLLPGASFSGIRWGPWCKGTIELTKEGKQFPLLYTLEGRKAAGKPVAIAGAVPLAVITGPAGKDQPVIALKDDARILAFGLQNVLQITEADLFPGMLSHILGVVPERLLSTEKLNYRSGEYVRIKGPAEKTCTITSRGGGEAKSRTISFNRSGRATFLPPDAGAYSIELQDGSVETAFSVQEHDAERMIKQPDPDILIRMAQLSGGKVLPAQPRAIENVLEQARLAGGKMTPGTVEAQWDRLLFYLLLSGAVLAAFLLGRRNDGS